MGCWHFGQSPNSTSSRTPAFTIWADSFALMTLCSSVALDALSFASSISMMFAPSRTTVRKDLPPFRNSSKRSYSWRLTRKEMVGFLALYLVFAFSFFSFLSAIVICNAIVCDIDCDSIEPDLSRKLFQPLSHDKKELVRAICLHEKTAAGAEKETFKRILLSFLDSTWDELDVESVRSSLNIPDSETKAKILTQIIDSMTD